MNKKADPALFSEQNFVLNQAGIRSGTCIVLGYPQETHETLQQTFDILCNNKIYPSVGFLCPAPGSVMYDYAVDHLRLNMTSMTNDELIDTVREHLKKLRDICEIDLDDEHLIANTVFEE